MAAIAEHKNGRVTIALIGQRMDLLIEQQERFMDRFETHLSQSSARDTAIALLEQAKKDHEKALGKVEEKVDMQKNRSDNRDWLAMTFSAIGTVVAAVIGTRN